MDRAPWWLPLVARAAALIGVAGPMSQKFLDYSGQVAFFTSLGIPQPGVMVIISGLVELAALLMIGLGVAGRLGALMLLGNMTVAVIAGGLNPLSGLVILGCLGVLLLGTGRYSLWQPEEALLRRRHA